LLAHAGRNAILAAINHRMQCVERDFNACFFIAKSIPGIVFPRGYAFRRTLTDVCRAAPVATCTCDRKPDLISKVDRSVLEKDGVRQAVRNAGHGHLLMSDADVAASLAATLAMHPQSRPVWVFGYGSLIWNPLMEYAERVPGRIHGFHRGFYLWSKVNRGSPEVPGLVLGLDRGGSCQGVAYRLHDDRLASELALLWRREMVIGTYRPRWVGADLGNRNVRAIAFVVDRNKAGYTGRLDDAQIVSIALKACGHYGTCADYLVQTAHSLEQAGIADPRMSRLAKLVCRARDSARQT
jgi:cation transport protein ChaC